MGDSKTKETLSSQEENDAEFPTSSFDEFRRQHFRHKLYHAAPGDTSFMGCDTCKITRCSFCQRIDKHENRMKHNKCYSKLRERIARSKVGGY